jgi:hypothetical protein
LLRLVECREQLEEVCFWGEVCWSEERHFCVGCLLGEKL